jgi:hypothetical protein
MKVPDQWLQWMQQKHIPEIFVNGKSLTQG